MTTRRDVFDRLFAMTELADNGCWVARCSSHDGYCDVWDSINKRTLRAHRLSYERFKGSIPDGLEIDHLCFVRNCINPSHLEAVTHDENMLRCRGRNFKAVCVNGHPRSRESIQKTSYACKQCTADRVRRDRAEHPDRWRRYRENEKHLEAR